MTHSHERGVVHRDGLAAGNVKITPNSNVKVAGQLSLLKPGYIFQVPLKENILIEVLLRLGTRWKVAPRARDVLKVETSKRTVCRLNRVRTVYFSIYLPFVE